MPRAYAQDLRDRVLAAVHEARYTHEALAALFRVGESTIRSWERRERTTGLRTPKPHGGGMPSTTRAVDASGTPVLVALVREHDDATLAELAAGYHARTGAAVSVSAVERACRRLDLRRKKKEPRARRAGA